MLYYNLTVCIQVPNAQVPYKPTYVSPNGFTSRIDFFNHGYFRTDCSRMFYSITNNSLFSDYDVALNVRFDINVDDYMFERNYSHKLASHKANTELVNQ